MENEIRTTTRSKRIALLLLMIGGWLGIHRFYTGKVGTGIIYLLTGGLFGIGTFIDALLIITNNFRDKEGALLKNDLRWWAILLIMAGFFFITWGIAAMIFSVIF